MLSAICGAATTSAIFGRLAPLQDHLGASHFLGLGRCGVNRHANMPLLRTRPAPKADPLFDACSAGLLMIRKSGAGDARGDGIGKTRRVYFREGCSTKRDQPESGYIRMGVFTRTLSRNFAICLQYGNKILILCQKAKNGFPCPNCNLLRKQRFGQMRRKYRMPRARRWAAPSSISLLAGD